MYASSRDAVSNAARYSREPLYALRSAIYASPVRDFLRAAPRRNAAQGVT